MFNTVLVLYVLAYSALGEVCNLVAGPSPIHFDNPKSWDCQHVPTASSDVVVALQQDCAVLLSNSTSSVKSLTVAGQQKYKTVFSVSNATFNTGSLTVSWAELSLSDSDLSLTHLSSTDSVLLSDGESSVTSAAKLNIRTRARSLLAINANVQSENGVTLMIELPETTDTNSSFVDSLQLQLGDNTWDAGKNSVKFILYSEDKNNTPQFKYPYHLIEGSKLTALYESLRSNIQLKTKFPMAAVSVSYTDTISITYTSPGKARQPENALLTYVSPSTSGDYWVGVHWQGAGGCDPDLVYKGTVLSFKDDYEAVEMNQTGLIKYPLPLEKCDIIAFTAKTMCYATDGKTEFHFNSSQLESSPLQVVIPLAPPSVGANGSIACFLDADLYRNCTILLTVPPYDCQCGGSVDSYEFNTTCSPLISHQNGTSVTLNCTASDFSPSILYRASCKWSAPNSPTGDLLSHWSSSTNLTARWANLTDGKDVPRPPFPLAVIICSGVFLAIGLTVSVVFVVKRQQSRRNAGYTTIQ